MSLRSALFTISLLVSAAIIGCGGEGSSGSTSGGSSESFECCINGEYFSCPSEAAVNACFDKSDSSGCKFTKSDPDGKCN